MLARSLGITAALTLTLARAYAADLNGTVIDAEGKAIAGAKIYGLTTGKAPIITNAMGAFSVSVKELEARKDFDPLVVAPGFVPRIMHVAYEQLQKIVLERGVSESGTVVSPEGKPMAGVRVRLVHLKAPLELALIRYYGEGGYYDAVTDAAGKWTINAIPPRDNRTVAIAEPKYLAERAFGEDNKLVARPAGIVTGRVLAPDGKPRANVAVWMISSQQDGPQVLEKTDAEGTFTFGSLPEGKWTVAVTVPDGDALMKARPVTIAAGKVARLGDLNLVPGVLVRGRVVEKGTDKGIPNVTMLSQGRHTATGGWKVGGAVTTDSDGRWTMRLLPGKARILPQAGLGSYTEVPVTITVSKTEGQQVPPIGL